MGEGNLKWTIKHGTTYHTSEDVVGLQDWDALPCKKRW